MGTSLTRLQKQEYLSAFDTLCNNLRTKLSIDDVYLGCECREEELLTMEQVIDTRIKMMMHAVYKYGPASANYLQYQLMLPLQNVMIRVKTYEKTSNVEFLLDAVNFLMLGYWQFVNNVIPIKEEDIVDYSVNVRQIIERKHKLSDRVMELLQLYSLSDDLCWLGVIAVIIVHEVQHPELKTAYYQYTAGIACEVAGTNVRELQQWKTTYATKL